MNDQKNYIIAATPRSGSFLLCEGLQMTGIAGFPQEYAAPEDVLSWQDFYGCASHPEYFFRFIDICRTPNGVFGAKLMWFQFVAWGQDARRYLRSKKSTFDIIYSMLGPLKIVRLVRRDTLRQAVSWVRACETGIWSQKRNDRSIHEWGNPTYNSLALRRAISALEHQNQQWEAALKHCNLPQMTICYEDLAADYEMTVKKVLVFLELPWSSALSEPLLIKQSDAITEEWVRKARFDLDLK